jgi:hypothetical protein
VARAGTLPCTHLCLLLRLTFYGALLLLRFTVSQGQIYITFNVALPVINVRCLGSSKKGGKIFLCSVYGVKQ